MDFLQTVVSFAFVIGVMVIVHELGHFLAARYFDVKVDAFAIGFGPRLFGFRRGETDYRVCLLPIGGYVKMAGENLTDKSTGDPREFMAKPRWQRLIIALMGPAFNGALAVALLTGLFMAHYERPTWEVEPAKVGEVRSGSAAERAGLLAGDIIVAVDGAETPTWESVRLLELTAVDETLAVTVQRGTERLTRQVTVEADEETGIGSAGWLASFPILLAPLPDKPASKAGIQDGDLLVAIDGREIRTWPQVIEVVTAAEGNPLNFDIEREGTALSFVVTPEFDKSETQGDGWRVGIGYKDQTVVTQLGLADALRASLDHNRKSATLIFRFLEGLVERRMSAKSIEGPLGIAIHSGNAARAGWPTLIMFMAMISLNLGIVNLLPIPVLDGGMIVMLLLESAMRRDFSLQVRERIVQVGLVFLLVIFGFVMYNDLVKSLSSG